jgi:ATP-binding cassette, subfamily B, bacterial
MGFSKVNVNAFSRPLNELDSGYACLLMIAAYYGKDLSEESFLQKVQDNSGNSSLLDISRAAENIGFRARYVNLTIGKLMNEAPRPCILQWDQYQYAILLPAARWKMKKRVQCVFPGKGIVTYTWKEIQQHWISGKDMDGQPAGGVLLLDPSITFHSGKNEKGTIGWRLMLHLLLRSRLQTFQLVCALLITSLVQLIIPFLLQGVVDVGVTTQNLSYIAILLIAQLTLIISRISCDLIRERLLLQMSARINVAIISDFWIKLARLPMTYFQKQTAGEILQRISDNKQVHSFVSGPLLSTMYSMLNFIVFAVVLMLYKLQLFFIFLIGISLYFIWMRCFLHVRRTLNQQLFTSYSAENTTNLQLIQGMQEVKLYNIEQPKRWELESRMVEIYKVNFKQLNFRQLQRTGAILINQGKDMVLTFTIAHSMIQGELTFGAMLAIQYIIGQLSAPIEQLVNFIQGAQDAKMSMKRVNEVHELEEEEKKEKYYLKQLPAQRSIVLKNLSFCYPGENKNPALHNIHLLIPEGKTTAIVGESGSGKTTLVKLLLKFFDDYEGSIKIGDADLKDISHSFWRNQCAAILQDSFLFNDTIAKNISMEYAEPDHDRLIEACRLANILSFIESLPNGFNTTVGGNGTGISQGQKQRILIARVIYKNPAFLFLDESTNSLDENNESVIVKNLEEFSARRTVIVIAHRLNTVRNADNIVVLHHGHIVEQGTHEELSNKKGRYFRLVSHQLELGN